MLVVHLKRPPAAVLAFTTQNPTASKSQTVIFGPTRRTLCVHKGNKGSDRIAFLPVLLGNRPPWKAH